MQEAKQIVHFKHLFSFPSPNKQHIFVCAEKINGVASTQQQSRSHRIIRFVCLRAQREKELSLLYTIAHCFTHKHEHSRFTLMKKIRKARTVEQSFAVVGYHLFAFSFLFAKKSIFVLKSEKTFFSSSKGCTDLDELWRGTFVITFVCDIKSNWTFFAPDTRKKRLFAISKWRKKE